MRVAIIFADGKKQINFTPENEDEKMALKLITTSDNIELAVKNGSFGNINKPYGIRVNTTMGEFLKCFDDESSIMLVLTPKEKS